MIPVTISCRDFVGFLDDYLAGALPAARRDEFDLHLSMCPSCVAYMNTYQQAVQLGRLAFEKSDQPVPAGVPKSLVRAILAARKRP